MTYLRKAWGWLAKHLAWVGGVLAALVVSIFAVKMARRKLGQVQDKLAVAQAMAEIGRLREAREGVAKRLGDRHTALAAIDRKLEANKRKIVEAHENGKDLSDDEMAAAFADLGL